MKRKLLLFMLSALGFSTACNHEREGWGSVDMYGVPRIDFRVQGKVTDRNGNPVQGIEVRNEEDRQTIRSSADGTYDLSGSSYPGKAFLLFSDVDGPENGEFRERELTVEFTEADRTGKGSGSWNNGSFARKDVDVVLEEKR